MLYDTLHIAGYYRGLLYNVDIVKDSLKAAKVFIEKMRWVRGNKNITSLFFDDDFESLGLSVVK